MITLRTFPYERLWSMPVELVDILKCWAERICK